MSKTEEIQKRNKYKVGIPSGQSIEIEASHYIVEDEKLKFENMTNILVNPYTGIQLPIYETKAIFNMWIYVEIIE